MAIIVPTGRATASATVVVTTVPATRGRIPWCGGSKLGAHSTSVRNSHRETLRKKTDDSANRMATIPVVTAIDDRAATNSTHLTRRSFQYRLPGPSIRSDAGDGAAAGAGGGEVKPAAMRHFSRSLSLQFPLQQFVGRQTDFLRAAEGGSGWQFCEPFLHDGVGILRQRYVLDGGGEFRGPLQVELDKRLDLGTLGRFLVDIDEQRPRERDVFSRDGVGPARQDRARAAIFPVDRQGLQLVGVGFVVAEGKVSERRLRAGDPLDDRVVVFAGGIIGAARFRLADDCFREV